MALAQSVNKYFNIRVYGLIMNTRNQILVTDEFRFGQCMTKFIGGGLEFGEGILACILREILEETQITVPPALPQHFHTTDHCIISAFNPRAQVIAVYYTLHTDIFDDIATLLQPFDFEYIEGAQGFRWINIDDFNTDTHLTFEMDKVAMGKWLNT